MFYADTIGLKAVLAKLKEFQAKFGDDFKPSTLLGKAGGGGRDVYEVVTRAPSSVALRDLLPRGEGRPSGADGASLPPEQGRERTMARYFRSPPGRRWRAKGATDEGLASGG